MAVTTGPLRVTRLDASGQPTGEMVEVDDFDISITETPKDPQEPLLFYIPKEINFTMELCFQRGGRRRLIEAIGGTDFWKSSERSRKRWAHRARKTRKRQR